MHYNVLCVDEQGLTGLELSNLLKGLQINFISVENEEDAFSRLKSDTPGVDAIVWVLGIPDGDPFEGIRRIKGADVGKDIPVAIVSGFTDKKYILGAMEAGAVEYIAKPYEDETVLKKMCSILEISFEKALRRMNEDIITFNFSEMFNREMKAAGRGCHPISIMLVSAVPDPYSKEDIRENVDTVVNLFRKVLMAKSRDTDTVFHYGMNRLIFLLPFADMEGAALVEKKVHDLFKTHSLIKRKNAGYRLITACVTFPQDGKVKDKLLKKLESNFSRLLDFPGDTLNTTL